jgi:hypothetical protein
MSASAYSLSVAIPTQGFRVTEGEPVPGGLQAGTIRHHFCPHCKSWMFTRENQNTHWPDGQRHR